jgi:hypothetical protein
MSVFENRTPTEIRDWYFRLAELRARTPLKKGEYSIAAFLLRYWLSNSGGNLSWDPPVYLVYSSQVVEKLDEHRQIFLGDLASENDLKKGIRSRIRASRGQKVDVELTWKDGITFPIISRDKETQDLAASLHTCEMRSISRVVASPSKGSTFRITFSNWRVCMADSYDWNRTKPNGAAKYVPMPNPDYGQKESWRIAPDSPTVIVQHSKAAWKVEDAGLAKPFLHQSRTWIHTALPADITI